MRYELLSMIEKMRGLARKRSTTTKEIPDE
jgi:hypothetical protein